MSGKNERPSWMDDPTIGHGRWGTVLPTETGALGVVDTLKELPRKVVDGTKGKVLGVLFDDQWTRMDNPITGDVTIEHTQHGKVVEREVVNTATYAGLQLFQGKEDVDLSTASIPTQALNWMDPETKKRVLGGNKK